MPPETFISRSPRPAIRTPIFWANAWTIAETGTQAGFDWTIVLGILEDVFNGVEGSSLIVPKTSDSIPKKVVVASLFFEPDFWTTATGPWKEM
ncbi:hypothetical protein PEX1_021930 [Penicillium expansum]|uniref:Uncharacterized protein n=1 Tax=Penicillium expansum TaxID=27334 RepID=A0A0A2ISC4_PENEN|nr:hypothetical protein PEX2_010650 [Penicillium expansum]KGO42019.1 hypothetical protein PEXP_054270 [Penicillium expansum]KGO45401.1 hypothetical protein PEX1_021930 [Penicillium expansum]KGO63264.1 hypothetical protein PEX2_010650 [Penicillium expansum]